MDTIYISLPNSVLLKNPKVKLGDICTIYCLNDSVKAKVRAMPVLSFSASSDQKVISCMKLIELISEEFPNASIVNLDATECILYFRPKEESKLTLGLKACFLILTAFLGTSYSIMSYSQDVDARGLIKRLYTMFTGSHTMVGEFSYNLGVIAYSLGLLAGMILFFNHGFHKKHRFDPTPLQVQMRLYENDVNSAILLDSDRKKETIDID